MTDDLDKVVGHLEAAALRVLWEANEPLGVRDVLEALNDGRVPQLAYTTVMTVLSRLADKDILRRERRGRGYVYEATAKDAADIAVRNVVRDFGDAAVSHFLEEARAEPELLARLRRIIAEG